MGRTNGTGGTGAPFLPIALAQDRVHVVLVLI
jgi:hypothetical protein